MDPPKLLPEERLEPPKLLPEGRLDPPKLLPEERLGVVVDGREFEPLYPEEGYVLARPILPVLRRTGPISRVASERVAGLGSSLVTEGRVRPLVMVPGWVFPPCVVGGLPPGLSPFP